MDEDATKFPKRKVALLLGFCGTGYSGMQINANAKTMTIEGELFKALCAAGAVSEANSASISKVSFNRAARTDKGVHAAGMCVSLKMVLLPDVIERINAHLPEQIRVYGYVRTNNKFEARQHCSSRMYEYLLPTYTLFPMSAELKAKYCREVDDDYVAEVLENQERQRIRHEALKQQHLAERAANDKGEAIATEEVPPKSKIGQHQDGNSDNGDVHEEMACSDRGDEDLEDGLSSERVPLISAERLQELHALRMTPVMLERVRHILEQFRGNHNFHNYTIGKAFCEKNALRFIHSFECSDPFVRDGIEWVSLKVHGQSFILHQIRKMVGMTILLMRTETPLDILPRTFLRVRVNIPKAPSLGLLLQNPVFGFYNERVARMRADASMADNFHGEVINFEMFRKQMDSFKDQWIYPEIFAREKSEGSFASWMEALNEHASDFAYLQPTGEIPKLFYDLAQVGINDPSRKEVNVGQKRAKTGKSDLKSKKVKRHGSIAPVN